MAEEKKGNKAGVDGSGGNADSEKNWRVEEVLLPLKEKGAVSLAQLSDAVLVENLAKVVGAIVAQIDKGNMVALKMLLDLAEKWRSGELITPGMIDSFAILLIESARDEREKLALDSRSSR